MTKLTLLLCIPLLTWQANAQKIPNVSCMLEDYTIDSVLYWQATAKIGKVQVAVLRDPAGEQEARFDLMHGASLLSLRYLGKEVLYGQSAGASVAMFAAQQRAGEGAVTAAELPYRTMYSPDQGGTSFDVPATVGGVACNGQQSMRAFSMMIDRGADNSFQKDPLLGVWKGKMSDNFSAGLLDAFCDRDRGELGGEPGRKAALLPPARPIGDRRTARPCGLLRVGPDRHRPVGFRPGAPAFPKTARRRRPVPVRTSRALVAGRYEDEARTTGVATVVPTAPWRTGSTFIRPNAEYLLLLYNAVWVAPRRTFGTVLEHSVAGLDAFRFSWYVCAGGWDQARAFGERQPAGKDGILPRAPSAPAPVIPNHDLVAVPAACQTTEYRMQPNQSENAVVIKDPAGEQTVLFDITQGGAIVSYKYRGQEIVWGYNGGGLLQMAFHNGMTNGPWRGDYNPTQAGDGSAMSIVTGVACQGTSAINILTMMLDFNHNNAFYDKALIAVWGGRVNDFCHRVIFLLIRWRPAPAGCRIPRARPNTISGSTSELCTWQTRKLVLSTTTLRITEPGI